MRFQWEQFINVFMMTSLDKERIRKKTKLNDRKHKVERTGGLPKQTRMKKNMQGVNKFQQGCD